MRFSDWQLNRLRDALRAYHQYGRGKSGTYYAWVDVSEAIAIHTGVKVPPERLRQFVEGLNIKNKGERRFPVPKDESLDAIENFVTNEKLNLLSKDELEEYVPGFQAPLRLLEYLDRKPGSERLVPAEKIKGCYSAHKLDPKHFVVCELTLQLPSEDGLMQVIETENIYEKLASAKYEHWSPQDRKEERKSRIMHGGWAVLTPEDNLFFFLKNDLSGKNRYYFTVALDLFHWSDAPMSRLALLHHNFPLELEESDTDRASIAQNAGIEAAKNILVFERPAGS